MMEPLWSPVVATGGNQWQIESPRKRQRQAKTVAAGCDQLPFGAHGKEGVDGSSPSEGSAKPPQRGNFCARSRLQLIQPDGVWSTFWNTRISDGRLGCRIRPPKHFLRMRAYCLRSSASHA